MIKAFIHHYWKLRTPFSPWGTIAPVREELFGIERLEQHAETLAEAQGVTERPRIVQSLQSRLNDNAAVLLMAYKALAIDVACDKDIAPAAEWLLDNYHLIEAQIRAIREDLPPGYYRQLPKLAAGPFVGYPRVFGLAWAYVAHTDCNIDLRTLRRFILAYQRVATLEIGELWAVAITLRIALIENLRRLIDQIMTDRKDRAQADDLATKLLVGGGVRSLIELDALDHAPAPLSAVFSAQLAKHLRDQDPRTTPALGWLTQRLGLQGTSIDEVVLHTQQSLGSSNVSIRNIVTSLQLIGEADWAELFECTSQVDERLRNASDFAAMDFATRNLYRSMIEELSRGSAFSELEVAGKLLALSAAASRDAKVEEQSAAVTDPGYHLLGPGRQAFERMIGFRKPLRLRVTRYFLHLGIAGYTGAIVSSTLALLGLALWALWDVDGGWLLLFAVLGLIPASEVATALVNRVVTDTMAAFPLPAMELIEGVPETLRTLVAVPVLLTSEVDLLEQIEQLEIHYLAGSRGDVTFALLSDGLDANAAEVEEDGLLATAAQAIAALNRRHGPGPAGERFLFLHRRRIFNPSQQAWIGWERKRGKLHELNRLLRGATDTSFIALDGSPPRVPAGVRFVITLDADTLLPRDTVVRLVGKMAHPLNRPYFNVEEQRVTSGYGILQPRVTPALPLGMEGSPFQRIFSGPAGMDPYAAAISDVYQDLFGEGSYIGKGIYDIDTFEAALAGRVAENTLLSHDLFEGTFARAGLATDIEVVEHFPNRYDVAARRLHRWVRGDWQLLPWILGHWRGGRAMPLLGRWKMLDNLRRSLLAPSSLAIVALSWLLPPRQAAIALLLVLATVAIPAFLPHVFSLLPRRSGLQWRSHFSTLGVNLRRSAAQVGLFIVFLPDHAGRMLDAILRTLVRLTITRRKLLEWTTAAMSSAAPRPGLWGFYRLMTPGVVLGLLLAAGAILLVPASWPLVLPFVLAWLAAPMLAFRLSQTPLRAYSLFLDKEVSASLRRIARQTWRYFETFVTPADNMLPPDNFQEDPKPVLAHRTSPTNIGLYLLSTVAARDFGWAGILETIERLEATLATMGRMARFNGHFFNWYDTTDLRPLDPAYVSAVDSGNLAGHLITLANACEEWIADIDKPDIREGMMDVLWLARRESAALADENAASRTVIFSDLENQLADSAPEDMAMLERLIQASDQLADMEASGSRQDGPARVADLAFWIQALKKAAGESVRDLQADNAAAHSRQQRLQAIADVAREMALAMDFAFLLDPDRKLLSIGYSLADNSMDVNCYDLLASEARLASLFAIAKGDVATRHWFRLGRSATPVGSSSALISWSGSMFEYLMPSLVMHAPANSLLEQTNRLAVRHQQSYARHLGVPWGISESAYNARDIAFTYQYSNFGAPGLGLKRGLSSDTVIAPYATALAAMIDPEAAVKNFSKLDGLAARGRYGYYEALDFTRSRLPATQEVAIVRAFMAHHQGMSIVAIANTLQDGRMRRRFHREPIIQACELLLQERPPQEVMVVYSLEEEVKARPTETLAPPSSARRLNAPAAAEPTTHLLSNGRYAVMLTSTGTGYSRWNGIAITRWREDAIRDDCGSLLFLKDVHSGKLWSASVQPVGAASDTREVLFEEDSAQYTHHDGNLTTTLDILVSGEDDGEIRRISLSNNGKRARHIEITSYAEVALALPSADNAHAAFSKLFVQTEYLSEFGVLVATRRPRSRLEPRLWAAHFCVVEGELAGAPQYETDRARFLGRGRAIADAAALMDGEPLSNTVGTVLDPVFSLRQRLIVPAGGVARIAFWTVVAPSRIQLLDLIDKHYDRSAYTRAKTLAWTQGQVQLRHLNIVPGEAADFQRLVAPILFADRRFRPSSEAITRGAGPQSGLWAHGISGDLPIVALRIDDTADMAVLHQLLRAHEYWRMKSLAVDLVIVNEHASSYRQDLQVMIDTAVRSSQSQPGTLGEADHGTIHVLRADLTTIETRSLLYAVARVVLHARVGNIARQIARLEPRLDCQVIRQAPIVAAPAAQTAQVAQVAQVAKGGVPPIKPAQALATSHLEFFNGLGGFDADGREYVTIQQDGRLPPAPWINVIANDGFGFQVSTAGSGYTWAQNSRENQLTQWSNDPVVDPGGEAIYLRDEDSGAVWGPTAHALDDGGTYVARHGFGYSRFSHERNGIALDLLQLVPLVDPVKISRLTVRNLSDRPRRLRLATYAEWVLGTQRGASAPFVLSAIDADTGALLARNPWRIAFSGRVAFSDLGGRQTSWTGDRQEFLGCTDQMSVPAALRSGKELSGATGAGLDPCAALAATFVLAPGASTEFVWLLGECASADEAQTLVTRYRQADVDTIQAEVQQHWNKLLGAIQVETPDRAMDIMLNGWLLYQTIACRIVARSAFYQASGAYGFRDQLQDGMALSFANPAMTRKHLLHAASRQFIEGDVQHWWLPHSGQGMRTRISDDRVWLAYATACYVESSGDEGVLDEIVPFLEGPLLRAGEHDAFFQPVHADQQASLFLHCVRGLEQTLELTGAHGLPLIGTGDWNDGMNLVGAEGKGESVWLGWLLIRTIALFAPLADKRDPELARRWRAHAESVRASIEREAWDGEWYRRATFDDGTWLGSKRSQACQIDSIAQTWAVLSGLAEPARAAKAMTAVDRHLIRREDGIALLFWPPFDDTVLEPGYIKGYPPGLRENGGQYSHAAMWAILAYAAIGDGDKAAELFSMINPINHARTAEALEHYKVEPYVIAADVYSVAPHAGRGGWTWYTGSAAWMYRAGIEGILGIRREGDWIVVSPCLPAGWPGFQAVVEVAATRYEIRIDQQPSTDRDEGEATLDGEPLPDVREGAEQGLRLPLDGKSHRLVMRLGVAAALQDGRV